MRRRILNISYPFAPVSNDTAGGAEQIVHILDEGLTERNWESYVVSMKGSQISGKNIPVTVNENDTITTYREYKESISRAVKDLNIELIHMHGLDFYKYLPEHEIPVLVTLHLPIEWYPEEILTASIDHIHFNCVSKTQFCNAIGKVNNLTGYISNGIRIKKYSTVTNKRDYLFSMGRICEEKGFHFAIEAAKKMKLPLTIAGKVYNYPAHKTYFKNVIKPQLNETIQFYESPGSLQKQMLLSEARCLLITSTAPETSSLSAMEALASGTPVIALRSGALPEIIDYGVSGFVINDMESLPDAIRETENINPFTCRRICEEKYDSQRMINQYLQLYENLI